MRWARGAVAVVVAMSVATGGAWLLGWSDTLLPWDAVRGLGAAVEVPDLTDLARPRAVADVEAADLVAEVDTAFSLTAPRGAVTAQDPAPGTRVRTGSVVRITVSRGVLRVEMPDAVGRPLAEVVGPLDEAGVEYRVEEVPSETVAKGVVVSQSPAAGRRVTARDQVRFVVSAGPEPRAVPLVAGISQEGAAWALGRSGFTVVAPQLRDDERPAGVVITTEPAPGTVVPRDAPVTLVVSAGPPPVRLPALVGNDAVAAEGKLVELGLVPVSTGGGAAGGVVTATSPAAGTSLRPGALVELQVSGT